MQKLQICFFYGLSTIASQGLRVRSSVDWNPIGVKDVNSIGTFVDISQCVTLAS
jgi:hypothetical protein